MKMEMAFEGFAARPRDVRIGDDQGEGEDHDPHQPVVAPPIPGRSRELALARFTDS